MENSHWNEEPLFTIKLLQTHFLILPETCISVNTWFPIQMCLKTRVSLSVFYQKIYLFQVVAFPILIRNNQQNVPSIWIEKQLLSNISRHKIYSLISDSGFHNSTLVSFSIFSFRLYLPIQMIDFDFHLFTPQKKAGLVSHSKK